MVYSCGSGPSGSSRVGMLTVLFIMFAAATVCVILDIFTTLRNISRAIDPTIGGIANDTTANIAASIQSALARVLVRCHRNLTDFILVLILPQYILGDAIVLWRAWVIGMRRRKIAIALVGKVSWSL